MQFISAEEKKGLLKHDIKFKPIFVDVIKLASESLISIKVGN